MSKIEWTRNDDGTEGKTWNPLAGCSIVSPGCTNCYAMRMASRINKMTPASHYEGLTQFVNGRPVWTGKIARAPDHIFNAPLKWRKPTRVFVNSMSDLFHEDVPDAFIDRVFAVMALSPRHTFQILTKRAERMRDYVSTLADEALKWERLGDAAAPYVGNAAYASAGECAWPLPNVWLGVSTEDRARADERIPLLLETPAAVRFISAEPLLGPIDLERLHYDSERADHHQAALSGYLVDIILAETNRLDWVIVGGESGPGKRPVDLEWMRSIRDQCKAANVPLFVKQTDKVIPIPDDLLIREWPKESRD